MTMRGSRARIARRSLLRRGAYGLAGLAAAALVGCKAEMAVTGTPVATATAPATPSVAAVKQLGTVQLIAPDASNLQFMSFWVALGAGLFKAQGVDLSLIGEAPGRQTPTFLLDGRADVAILPPPMALPLIAQDQPVVLFANLLRNDPINVIVHKDIVEARRVALDAPVAERIQALRGLSIGVAPGPPTRLRAMLDQFGINADRDIQMVVMPPVEENQAFADRKVDGLYAHTPFLERALVQQGAVMLVNQSKGEVPAVSARVIHTLVTTRTFLGAKPDVLLAITKAIVAADRMVHTNQPAAVDAIMHSGIAGLERRLVETIVSIYEPAIPDSPDVTPEGLQIANRLFPESQTPPDISKVDLMKFIAPEFARQAVLG